MFARIQSWSSDGAEVYGTETAIYRNEPCLLVPMTVQQATLAGLGFDQRPYTAFFRANRFVTRSSTGQAYQDVRIRVGTADYMVVGAQQRFGEGAGVDDIDHIEFAVVRRDSA